MFTPKFRRWITGRSEGYALLITMVVSSVMLIFGATMMTIAMYESREANRWKRSNEAYFLARAGISEAVYRLKSDYENMTLDGYIGNNTENQALMPGQSEKTYSFQMAPASTDLHFIGSPYMTGAFSIEACGTRGTKNRRIEARIERDTFLRYSRFVQLGDLSYAANANILADLYVGGDLNLNGYPIEFWGDLEVGDDINNEWNGIYHGDITGTGIGIDLERSVDLNYYRSLTQGLIPGEGVGQYLSTSRTVDLSLYDFTDPNNPKYDGNSLGANFNGVIFCEGDIYLKGLLEGRSLTFVSNDDIIAVGDVRTGNKVTASHSLGSTTVFNKPLGTKQTENVDLNSIITTDIKVIKFRMSGSMWSKMRMTLREDGVEIAHTDLVRTSLASDNVQTAVINENDLEGMKLDPALHSYTAEIEYYSSGSGDNSLTIEATEGEPVNIGLVAKDEFYIDSGTAKQLTIDAAILGRDRSWNALGDLYSHPNGFDSNVWELTINGPIITKLGGSAGPWSNYGIRNYRYDMDMIEYAPPAFPVPSDWWKVAYWKHLKEGEGTI